MEKTNAYINIQNEAGIHANGYHNNGNCDPCIILETGETFTSQLDLAKHLGVNRAAVSNTICGRQQTCKGYHIISMSRMAEGADLVLFRLREAFAENERRKADEDDARKWREYQAEQEAIRKAEEKRLEDERKAKEKHDADVQKAINKIQRRTKIYERITQQYIEAATRLGDAEEEYEALTGHKYGAEDCVEVA